MPGAQRRGHGSRLRRICPRSAGRFGSGQILRVGSKAHVRGEIRRPHVPLSVMLKNLVPTNTDPLPTAPTATSRSSVTSCTSFFGWHSGRNLLFAAFGRRVLIGAGSTVLHMSILLLGELVLLLSHGDG